MGERHAVLRRAGANTPTTIPKSGLHLRLNDNEIYGGLDEMGEK